MKCGSMTFRNNYDGTCDGGRILKINVTDHKKYTVHIIYVIIFKLQEQVCMDQLVCVCVRTCALNVNV